MTNKIVMAVWKHDGVKYRWTREWFYNSLLLELNNKSGDSTEFFKNLRGEEILEKEVLLYGFIPRWKVLKENNISNFLEAKKKKTVLHEMLIDKYGFKDNLMRK